MRMQSAGTLDPISSKIMSPTTRSYTLTLWVAPYFPLITAISSSLTSLYSLTNYLSFTQSFKADIETMTIIAR
jgi:hypothetical protein